MATRAVSDGEIIRLAWEAEDRRRAGAAYLATRKLARGGALYLIRFTLGGRPVWSVIASRERALGGGWLQLGEDIYDFSDGDAAWRAAIGWNGKGEREGFARYRRRA